MTHDPVAQVRLLLQLGLPLPLQLLRYNQQAAARHRAHAHGLPAFREAAASVAVGGVSVHVVLPAG